VALVTSITQDRMNPDRGVVKVDRRRVVTLHLDGIAALGIREGVEWTPALADHALTRALYEKARVSALRWLSQRSMSRARLGSRLQRYQLAASDRVALLDELEARGLINDAAFAEGVAETKLSREPVALDGLVDALRKRGIDEETARAAASGAVSGRDQASDARELAARRLRSLPPGLDDAARRRRLFAYLARRGFDEEAALQAVEYAVSK